jgi:cell division septum initiation protein DivIVA
MNELRKAAEEEKTSIINKAHNDAKEILSKAEEEKARIEIEIEKLKGLSSELKARIISIVESYKRLVEE